MSALAMQYSWTRSQNRERVKRTSRRDGKPQYIALPSQSKTKTQNTSENIGKYVKINFLFVLLVNNLDIF